MKECIICRKQKTYFPDEHVIPKAIGGYYRIDKVCVDCNNKMGHSIDYRITDHLFIKFQKFLLDVKTGKLPKSNPLNGTHTFVDNPNQEVQLKIDNNGQLVPYVLPKVPKLQRGTPVGEFTIVLDKKDAGNIHSIVDKLCERNGIPKENVRLSKKVTIKQHSMVRAKISIDINHFKMALLKMSYEFTVDTIPTYYKSERAKLISNILKTVDFKKLNREDLFIGSGFDKEILGTFAHFVDFKKGNHYLILIDMAHEGLYCFVNLYNIVSVGVEMAKDGGYMKNNIIFGVNDLMTKSFKKSTLKDLLMTIYSPIELRFKYQLKSDAELALFNQICNSDQFDYYRIKGKIPLLDKNGTTKYNDVADKIKQRHLKRIEKGDVVNSIITEIELDEELYIALLPSNQKFQVISIQTEQYKKRKM